MGSGDEPVCIMTDRTGGDGGTDQLKPNFLHGSSIEGIPMIGLPEVPKDESSGSAEPRSAYP